MDPQHQFCPNPDCPARGRHSQGNIRVHSQQERRYRCTTCGRTFGATTGTPCFRVKYAADLVTTVLTLVCHGCPLQAIVAAFGLDERTVAAWQARAGQHCQRVDEQLGARRSWPPPASACFITHPAVAIQRIREVATPGSLR